MPFLLDEDVIIEDVSEVGWGSLIDDYADILDLATIRRWAAVQDADRDTREARKEVDELTRILTPVLEPGPTDRWPVRAFPPFRFEPSRWALEPLERYVGAYREQVIVIEGSLR